MSHDSSVNNNGMVCKRCGRCCKEMFFVIDKAYTEDGVDHMVWAKYHGLKIRYRRDGKGKKYWGIELDAVCSNLVVEVDGTTNCAIYDERPRMCREYTGEEEFHGCGYAKNIGKI